MDKKKPAKMQFDTVAEKKHFSFILTILFWMVLLGIVLLFLMSLYILPDKNTPFILSILFFSSIFIIIGLSALLIGVFVGFIFAIPKENSVSGSSDIKQYLNNDNLVQISDWLTKIIVGVGLTQLYKIPSKLKELADYFSSLLGLHPPYGVLYGNVLVASVIYFIVLGFLIAYYWTRLKYKILLTVTDEDIDSITEEEEKKEIKD